MDEERIRKIIHIGRAVRASPGRPGCTSHLPDEQIDAVYEVLRLAAAPGSLGDTD
jgi:hypothetical protein